MQLTLYHDIDVTLTNFKTQCKNDVMALAATFLARESAFINNTLEGITALYNEQVAYVAAGSPATVTEDVYPLIYDEVVDTADTAAVVAARAESLYWRLGRVRDSVTSWVQRAIKYIDAPATFSGTANAWFKYRNPLLGIGEMGITVNKSYITPRPYTRYEAVSVIGNGVDTLTLTLPAHTNNIVKDLVVKVESYDPGDPWDDFSTVTHTNPTSPLSLTFVRSTDPLYVASNFNYRITVTCAPMVKFVLFVHTTP